MKRLVRPEIFRNKRTTLRAIPLSPFQPVGTEIPVPFAQFSFGRRLAPGLFSAFSSVWRWALITGCRSFSFHFLSYRSKWHLFKIVVSSVRVQISWNETATTAAISTIGKKAFPFHPEGFRNFQSEIFPKWKAPRAPSWGLRLQITVIFETVHLSTKAWTSFHCVICMLVGSECSKGLLYRSRWCYLVKRSILFQAFDSENETKKSEQENTTTGLGVGRVGERTSSLPLPFSPLPHLSFLCPTLHFAPLSTIWTPGTG